VVAYRHIDSADPALVMDQRVILHGVSWDQYEALLKMRGDDAGVRVAYLNGELEFMSPSYPHEAIKTTIARLLEIWALETNTELTGVGSWTVRRAPKKRGVEPDECYIVGDRRVSAPDLAIEVMWTEGGLDKLDIYRGLRVKEVWRWREGRIEVHVLGKRGYERHAKSAVLPALDLGLLSRHVGTKGSQTQAVRSYLTALRRSRSIRHRK
jgi:Uma2 family endonuclease